MHDLVEWAAAQPWCDGHVGMVGISYFAMTQLEAAVEQPAHLRAIFPVAVTTDLYEAANHHGLFSADVHLAVPHHDRHHRPRTVTACGAGRLLDVDASRAPRRTGCTRKFAHHGRRGSSHRHARWRPELSYDAHPWDDLWQDIAVDHQLRDHWWDERDLHPAARARRGPGLPGMRLGQRAAPSALAPSRRWIPSPTVPTFASRCWATHGLAWPWESLHVEALAWFDHWLKGRDTGILDGPPIRYVVPGVDEWEATHTWPPQGAQIEELALRADGVLGGTDVRSREHATSSRSAPGSTGARPSPRTPRRVSPGKPTFSAHRSTSSVTVR